MSIKQFAQKDNIQVVWDIITEEEAFKFLSPSIQDKINNIFVTNIVPFFESEKKTSTTLVELNKKYILLIVNHIRNAYPYKVDKIKIYKEPIANEPITYEEIHSEKKSQFDKDFAKRQEDFYDLVNVKIPEVPTFSDNMVDTPIKEMDKIVKEMQLKRNYEVDTILRESNANAANNANRDTWLTPQETSIKPNKGLKHVSFSNNTDDEHFNILSNL
jgi:hypothetical protein